ncbi:MAG: ACT domain-containing protein, partial [Deltaproteobacteria bacterium]|nr:ACT domain-containing protein [Deltaproteobacteria bacterium]
GDAVGETMFYGRGAGMMPTASAVVADIVAAEKSFLDPSRLPGNNSKVTFAPMDHLISEYYLRFSVVDRPGVLGQIANALGAHDISIASVDQQGQEKSGSVPIIVMVHRSREENVRKAIRIIDRLEQVLDKTVCIRVERLS